MKTNKIKFAGIDSQVVSFQVGDTMNVFIGDSGELDKEIAKAIKKGLAKGETVVIDGVKTFRQHVAIHDSSKQGSAAFIWDKSGERVKHEITEVTIAVDGTRTEEVVGTVFRNF
jgi:UDP-N-acetylmuramyl tripeptide synthase